MVLLSEAVLPYLNLVQIFGIYIGKKRNKFWFSLIIIQLYFIFMIMILVFFPEEILPKSLQLSGILQLCKIPEFWNIVGRDLRYIVCFCICIPIIYVYFYNRNSSYMIKAISIIEKDLDHSVNLSINVLYVQDFIVLFFSFLTFCIMFIINAIYISHRNYHQNNTSFPQELFCNVHYVIGGLIICCIICYGVGLLWLNNYICNVHAKSFILYLKKQLDEKSDVDMATVLMKTSSICYSINIINKFCDELQTLFIIIAIPLASIAAIYVSYTIALSSELFILLCVIISFLIMFIAYALFLSKVPSLIEQASFCIMDFYFRNESNYSSLILLYVIKRDIGYKSKNFFFFNKKSFMSVSKFHGNSYK
ncbi:uncharacterized protein LOC111616042 [Centruroides sculpturatus]|uniref:uncharacterized protein LOC111616042 n=1 Tax=Centruroides sculpturatus TaxID=218467 RepID=UPI000C6EA41C|nr:uncharacterized protein LOC111616042 [Centruroides sculpturatus]